MTSASVGGQRRIRTPDQRLRVFVSSTLRELADDRRAVEDAVRALHLTPVMFELGARPHPPKELYRAYLEQSDVFVGLYWQQYGWVAPGEEISGLEDEYLLSAQHPRLVYVREPAPDREPRLAALLDRMRDGGMSYRHYHGPDELADLVSEDLAVLLSERFAADPVAAIAATDPPQAVVPGVPSRFIGRRSLLDHVCGLLQDPHARLVNLVGPGGTGKSRLAYEAARLTADAFADGVVSVPLAAVRAAERVPTAITAALGVPETAGRTAAQALVPYFAGRHQLLLLDNFEQVSDAAPLLVELLGAAPDLEILVTSRVVLRVTGEVVVQVPPLEIPRIGSPPEVAARSEAVELFVERARATGRMLDDGEETMAAIAELCRRLDGLPLAIELAAARTSVLDPAEILARLGSGLDLLTNGSRDRPPHQQTLELTIRWSYDLLPERERSLLGVLGVFVGGFSLRAAERIGLACGIDGVLDGLSGLVDRSLLNAIGTVAGQPRYQLLEVVREFALARLREDGGLESAQDAHARHYLEEALANRGGFEDGDERRLVEAYDADRDNLLLAMRRHLEAGRAGDAAEMGDALWQYWWIRGLFEDALGVLQGVRDRRSSLSDRQFGEVSFAAGMCHFGMSDWTRARPIFVEARAAYERANDEAGAALCAVPLGVIAVMEGDSSAAELFEHAIRDLRAHHDDWGLAFALFGYGRVLILGGRFDDAVEALEESVRRAGRTEILRSHCLLNFGWALRGTGALDDAAEALLEGIDRFASMGNPQGIARVLECLAAVELDRGRARSAARLFGAAEGARRSIGASVWSTDVFSHAVLDEALRASLDPDDLEAELERGIGTELDEAVALAHRAVARERAAEVGVAVT